jgi:hypothetical protein
MRSRAYTVDAMIKLLPFQAAAREDGFAEVKENPDGTVLWLRKPAAGAEDRMCIDSLTNSVTVFWGAPPSSMHSKTFRNVPALREWFALKR